jgi:hypothetical protein
MRNLLAGGSTDAIQHVVLKFYVATDVSSEHLPKYLNHISHQLPIITLWISSLIAILPVAPRHILKDKLSKRGLKQHISLTIQQSAGVISTQHLVLFTQYYI